jgi:hypothetical protein
MARSAWPARLQYPSHRIRSPSRALALNKFEWAHQVTQPERYGALKMAVAARTRLSCGGIPVTKVPEWNRVPSRPGVLVKATSGAARSSDCASNSTYLLPLP